MRSTHKLFTRRYRYKYLSISLSKGYLYLRFYFTIVYNVTFYKLFIAIHNAKYR
jgi:hypothetical protein